MPLADQDVQGGALPVPPAVAAAGGAEGSTASAQSTSATRNPAAAQQFDRQPVAARLLADTVVATTAGGDLSVRQAPRHPEYYANHVTQVRLTQPNELLAGRFSSEELAARNWAGPLSAPVFDRGNLDELRKFWQVPFPASTQPAPPGGAPGAPTRYYTYRDNVPLKAGQTVGYTPGEGYYAKGEGSGLATIQQVSDAASGGGYPTPPTTTHYYTYRDSVPLKAGQTVGYAPGKGYYAKGEGSGPATIQQVSDAASGGGYTPSGRTGTRTKPGAKAPPTPSSTGPGDEGGPSPSDSDGTKPWMPKKTTQQPSSSQPKSGRPGQSPLNRPEPRLPRANTPARPHMVSRPLPEAIVCGPHTCAVVTGHVEVQSRSTAPRGPLRVDEDGYLSYRTGRGATVSDGTLRGALGALGEQTGQNVFWGEKYHHERGLKLDLGTDWVDARTRGGNGSVSLRSVADVKALKTRRGDIAGYKVVASTALRLADRTELTDSVSVTIKLVPNTFSFKKGQGPTWGKLQEPVESTRNRGKAGSELTRIAAAVVARSEFLATDREPPGGRPNPQPDHLPEPPGWRV